MNASKIQIRIESIGARLIKYIIPMILAMRPSAEKSKAEDGLPGRALG